MESRPDWYLDAYLEGYLRLNDREPVDQMHRFEASAARHLLDCPAGAQVLDMCCGIGGHSVELARAGLQVTGYDLSEVLLERCRRRARENEVDVEWVRGDIREMPFESQFDAAVCFNNSLGGFESEEENLRVLQRLYRALKPGGRLLWHMANREAFIRGFQKLKAVLLPEDLLVLEQREFDLLTSRLHLRTIVIRREGERQTIDQYGQIYSLWDADRMLKQAGFVMDRYTGGLRDQELTFDTPMVVVLSRKPDRPAPRG